MFDIIIKENLGDAMTRQKKPPPYAFNLYSDGDLDPLALNTVDTEPVETNGTAVFEYPITDHCIHAEINLPQED